MILAIDSSLGTAVAITDDQAAVVASKSVVDKRSHAEAIGPLIAQALEEAGEVTIEAVVMGVGPGPFTGLRVGMAAAHAFAWGRGVELWPVLSHDCAAWGITRPLVVASDARRGEFALTRYQPDPAGGLGQRMGPPTLVAVSSETGVPPEVDGVQVKVLDQVDPVGLVRAALWYRSQGISLLPPQAVYLREPDVTMPQ